MGRAGVGRCGGRNSAPGTLKCLDNPPVLIEVTGERALGFLDTPEPESRPVRWQKVQPDADIKLTGENRMANGERPERARLAGVGIVMSQRTDLA